MPLNPQGEKILQQWQENRPKMCWDRDPAVLERMIQERQDLWAETMSQCLGRHARNGGPMDYHQAEEIANPIIFLPSEEDVPELPGDPAESLETN